MVRNYTQLEGGLLNLPHFGNALEPQSETVPTNSMDVKPILIAGVGALAIKLLYLSELHKIPKDKRPDLTEWLYWLQFLVSPGIGAFLAWIYLSSHIELPPLLALNVGASAPLFLKTLADTIPRNLRGPID